MNDDELVTLRLTINGQEIELTVDQAQEVRAILNRLFGSEPVYVPYPVPQQTPQPAPQPWWQPPPIYPYVTWDHGTLTNTVRLW